MNTKIEDKSYIEKEFTQEMANASATKYPRATIRDINRVMLRGELVSLYSDDGLRCVDVDGAKLQKAATSALYLMRENNLLSKELINLVAKASKLHLIKLKDNGNNSFFSKRPKSKRSLLESFVYNRIGQDRSSHAHLDNIVKNAHEGSGEFMALVYILTTE